MTTRAPGGGLAETPFGSQAWRRHSSVAGGANGVTVPTRWVWCRRKTSMLDRTQSSRYANVSGFVTS
jgi:hypothetical protein